MAKVTNLTLRHKVLYHIYVANFTEAGTIQGIIPELGRLKKLGVDIIQLEPIFKASPNEDGTIDPYLVQGLEEIDPRYGEVEDLLALSQAVHDQDMQLMLSVPMVSFSSDSPLIQAHPDFFLRNDQGEFYSRFIPEGRACDLDYTNPKLWDYLIKYLEYWAYYVDGYSVPAAALIRPEFWTSARAEVEDVHPYFYWAGGQLDEVTMRRLQSQRIQYWSEGELYANFDMLDEAVYSHFRQYYRDQKISLNNYMLVFSREEIMSPWTYVRMRGTELIYDAGQNRIAQWSPTMEILETWTAFTFFVKGITSLVMGQEYALTEPIPTMTDQAIDWTINHDLSPLMKKLSDIKKREVCKSGYHLISGVDNHTIKASYHYYNQNLVGLFKVKHKIGPQSVEIGFPDGHYKNLLSNQDYYVKDGMVTVDIEPVILSYEGPITLPTL
ncbi:hypothetical protein AWM75_04960 [Aerococcus urinaehominis]|uniref:Uncharacterized protein n=1 Tax=Aerococcus urinaehominis TaxID=128944 RepID=A0A0X8FLA1_9LACT|nr:alpha-amylase family glycosyl hydrolase [Aerococcus urinaehominis]AMB99380.1 hypothetical protein AWM75_04960 [Aerococcus urinaehominis]SDM23116.1 Alpha amylase, catalytic domain [Aerococcus urinaehominis]